MNDCFPSVGWFWLVYYTMYSLFKFVQMTNDVKPYFEKPVPLLVNILLSINVIDIIAYNLQH